MKSPHAPNGNGAADRPGRLKATAAPIFDLELERHFLGSCVIYPDLIMSSGVVTADFYSAQHETIFAALVALVADGIEVDSVSLRARLFDTGHLNNAGGEDTLLNLTSGIPIRSVDSRRLRKLARQRAVQLAARRITFAGAEELDLCLAAYDHARRELEAVTAPGARAPTLEEVIPLIAQTGPRLPTGIPALDAATRGGIPMGRFVSLIGSPGSSKTNFATWLGDGWERAGCAVIIMAADESRESVVTRLGQMDGHDRDMLEGPDPGRRNAFTRNCRPRALKVVDPFEDKIPLEAVEAELLEIAGGKPRVLIVDSLQTVPCNAAAECETKREAIEAIVVLLNQIAKRGTLVIAISEMSRAGYRTGSRDKDISALAAGAESRAIEYASHLQLGLKPVRGERGVIDVEVAKNRLGPDRPDLRLALDFARLSFREIERPEDEGAESERLKASGLRQRVLATVVKVDCRSLSAVVREAGIKRRDGMAICRELLEEGAIKRIEGVYRVTPEATRGGDS